MATEHARSTISIPQRRQLAVIGLSVAAVVIFIFFIISYQLIFIGYTILTLFIFSSYLVLWLQEEGRKTSLPSLKNYPSVSIIIPSFNAKETIFDCLRACKRMKYPKKVEIIVVDDGSTDGSYELLKKVKGIKLVKNLKNCGKAAALNRGLEHAKGEIVACIDSDSYPAENALIESVKHFYEDKKVASVVVFICANKPKTLLQKIQEIEYLISFGFFFRTIASIDGLYVTPGPTALYRKRILLELGGFDEKNLTEDMEIALRFQKHGYKIKVCHETVVRTDVPETLGKLFRQRLRWYRGGVMNILKYIDLFFNPKYGDFGLFILPTTLGAGFFAALFMAWTLMTLSRNIVDWLWPVVANFSAGVEAFSATLNSGIIVFQSAWILGIFTLSIWAYFLIKSFEITNRRLKARHFLPLLLLIVAYPVFIGLVFLVAYIYELFGFKYSW
ncbi:MAG: glycosyltransferase family 2 protein [Candidatus Micrarchaeota archaeon]|nr:glycosyltransferase family 2 protein [Candidatus Micrarchaeota archaeon]